MKKIQNKQHKRFSWFLIFVFVSALLIGTGLTAYADDPAILYSGECGDNVEWYINENHELHLHGTGDMWDYTYDNQPSYYEHADTITGLVIENGITSIGENAFCHYNYNGNPVNPYSNMRGSLVIPESVKTIKKNAFAFCNSFDGTLDLGSVETIKKWAFIETSFTGSLIIPDRVTEIGESAFARCHNFNGNIVLSNSLTTISNSAFYDCTGLTGTLIIPDSVEILDIGCFDSCIGLTGLEIGSNVKRIEEDAFRRCTGLTGNLVLPDSLTFIGQSAFEECYRLSGDLIIPDNVTDISALAFNDCRGFDGELKLSANLKLIDDDAFWRCVNLTGVLRFPENIEVIRSSAFLECASNTDFIKFFSENDWLYHHYEEISRTDPTPETNGYIEYRVYTTSSLYYNAVRRPEYQKIENVLLNQDSVCLYLNETKQIGFDIEPFDAYYTDVTYQSSDESVATVDVNGLITGISGGSAIVTMTITDGYNPKSVEIPVTVKDETILYSGQCGDDAWWKIGSDRVLTIFAGVSGKSAMWNIYSQRPGYESYIDSFDTLVIENGITHIGENTFYRRPRNGNSELKYTNLTGDLVIPDSVVSIGMYAFKNAGFDGALHLGNSLKTIDSYSFSGCNGFTGDLIIPDSVEEIRYQAFMDCSGFDGNLVLSNNLWGLGDFAFKNCSSLTGNIVLPSDVWYINTEVFSGCSGFNGTLTMSDSTVEILQNAFYGCSNLTGQLIIPDSVEWIGECAFHGCALNTDMDRFFENYPDFVAVEDNSYTNIKHIQTCCADCMEQLREDYQEIPINIDITQVMFAGKLVRSENEDEKAWILTDENNETVFFETNPLTEDIYVINNYNSNYKIEYEKVLEYDEDYIGQEYEFETLYKASNDSYLCFYDGKVYVTDNDWYDPEYDQEYDCIILNYLAPECTQLDHVDPYVFNVENDFGVVFADDFESNPIDPSKMYRGVYSSGTGETAYSTRLIGYVNTNNFFVDWDILSTEDLAEYGQFEPLHISFFFEDGEYYGDLAYVDGKLVLLTYYADENINVYNDDLFVCQENDTHINISEDNKQLFAFDVYPTYLDDVSVSVVSEDPAILQVVENEAGYGFDVVASGETAIIVSVTQDGRMSFQKEIAVTAEKTVEDNGNETNNPEENDDDQNTNQNDDQNAISNSDAFVSLLSRLIELFRKLMDLIKQFFIR